MLPMTKPETCRGCPLHEIGKGFCPDAIAPHPKILLIGEAPGKTEVATGKPFQGRAGFVLDNWLIRAVPLLQLAKERGEITVMNTLRCLPPEVQGRAYPKGETRIKAEAHCRQYDPDLTPYETVILFGDSPQRAFFGAELAAEDAVDKQLGHELKGVMGRIGREYVKDGKRWVFAPHPAYILRQPALVEHGQAALRIAANTEEEVKPEYVSWSVVTAASDWLRSRVD